MSIDAIGGGARAALFNVSACVSAEPAQLEISGMTVHDDLAGDRIVVLCAPEDMWMPLWKFDKMLKLCPGIQVPEQDGGAPCKQESCVTGLSTHAELCGLAALSAGTTRFTNCARHVIVLARAQCA